MSALITHATAGLLYGLFAWVIGHRDGAFRLWWHPVALFAIIGFASLAPDLDIWIGTHRQTFHNIWALIVLPALAVTLVHLHPRVPGTWVQPALHLLPGAIVSELWYDLFAPSLSGYTEVFWPFSSAGYEQPNQAILYLAEKPIYDAGSLLGLLILYYLVLGLLHRSAINAILALDGHRAVDAARDALVRSAQKLPGPRGEALGARLLDLPPAWRDAARDRHLGVVAAALAHVALAVVPVVYVVWTGQLVRVSI